MWLSAARNRVWFGWASALVEITWVLVGYAESIFDWDMIFVFVLVGLQCRILVFVELYEYF